jgi:hypothetical protein
LFPGLADSTTDGCQQAEDGRDEDCASTAKVEVAGVTKPASKERTPDIGAGIDDSYNEIISPAIGMAGVLALAYAKFTRKR